MTGDQTRARRRARHVGRAHRFRSHAVKFQIRISTGKKCCCAVPKILRQLIFHVFFFILEGGWGVAYTCAYPTNMLTECCITFAKRHKHLAMLTTHVA